MSVTRVDAVLDPIVRTESRWEYSASWPGHPDCERPSTAEQEIIAARAAGKLRLIGMIEDDNASWSYDDFALVRVEESYYLLNSSGCSCPSPSETWNVEIGPAALADIRKHLVDGKYEGYTVPGRQMAEFLELIDAEAAK